MDQGESARLSTTVMDHNEPILLNGSVSHEDEIPEAATSAPTSPTSVQGAFHDSNDVNGIDVNGSDEDRIDVNGIDVDRIDVNGIEVDRVDVNGNDEDRIDVNGIDVDGPVDGPIDEPVVTNPAGGLNLRILLPEDFRDPARTRRLNSAARTPRVELAANPFIPQSLTVPGGLRAPSRRWYEIHRPRRGQPATEAVPRTIAPEIPELTMELSPRAQEQEQEQEQEQQEQEQEQDQQQATTTTMTTAAATAAEERAGRLAAYAAHLAEGRRLFAELSMEDQELFELYEMQPRRRSRRGYMEEAIEIIVATGDASSPSAAWREVGPTTIWNMAEDLRLEEVRVEDSHDGDEEGEDDDNDDDDDDEHCPWFEDAFGSPTSLAWVQRLRYSQASTSTRAADKQRAADNVPGSSSGWRREVDRGAASSSLAQKVSVVQYPVPGLIELTGGDGHLWSCEGYMQHESARREAQPEPNVSFAMPSEGASSRFTPLPRSRSEPPASPSAQPVGEGDDNNNNSNSNSNSNLHNNNSSKHDEDDDDDDDDDDDNDELEEEVNGIPSPV